MKWFLTKQDPVLPLNHEQWRSKSMLWKYLREDKRIKHLLDSKVVSPRYTHACEYLFLNVDKMPGSSREAERHRGRRLQGAGACFWGQGLFFRRGGCVQRSDTATYRPPGPWPQQPALLTPTRSALQHENVAQPIPVEPWLTSMGYQRFSLSGTGIYSGWVQAQKAGLHHVGNSVPAKVNYTWISPQDLRGLHDLQRISPVSCHAAICWHVTVMHSASKHTWKTL